MQELTENQDAPQRRRRRWRRVIAAAVVTLLVGAGVSTYLSTLLLAPIGESTASADEVTVTVPEPRAFDLPYGSSSAISMVGAEQFPATSGVDGILVSSGSAEPQAIASITKLITALVVLDAYPIAAGEVGPTLTFTEADADLYDIYYVQDASIQPMEEGASMTLRDALEVMLVTSATNYADVVSTWAFGSRFAFLDASSAWLAARGLVNTTIVDATGIDPGNVSTPAELIALGKLALGNPVLAEIVSSSELDVAGLGHESNTNTLLGNHGINGVKTGTLEEAGSCLLFSAVMDVGLETPITVVGVVLGGGSHRGVDASVITLLDSVLAQFHDVTLIEQGAEVGTYSSAWGDEAIVVARDGASIRTWSDTPVTATITLDPVTTVADGDQVGLATFTSGDKVVTVPLVVEGSIEEPDGWWRIGHPEEVL